MKYLKLTFDNFDKILKDLTESEQEYTSTKTGVKLVKGKYKGYFCSVNNSFIESISVNVESGNDDAPNFLDLNEDMLGSEPSIIYSSNVYESKGFELSLDNDAVCTITMKIITSGDEGTYVPQKIKFFIENY